MRREVFTTCLVACGVLVGAFPARAQDKPPAYRGPVFEDVAQRSGLTVPHQSSPDNAYVIESMSEGGAWAWPWPISTTTAGWTFTLLDTAATFCIAISATASLKMSRKKRASAA